MDNKSGLIFHIIRGSFVDGHGIRTTVFMKGCPLRCVWCCNPEGQAGYPEIKFNDSECNGCGKCVSVCPINAIRIDTAIKDSIPKINRESCTNCGKCIEVCYTEALTWFGRYLTADELFDIVNKDEPFYLTSGGGVTIGGGEPTFQPEFLLSFMKKCKDNHLHIAIDTCGYTRDKDARRILEEADLLLFDLKCMDANKHLEFTGVPNTIILDNLKRLNDIGKPIIVRIPVVPGYTDSLENIKSSAELIYGLKAVERIDLIGYHEFGLVKYCQLGKDYMLQDVHPLSEERLKEISKVFGGYGLNVQLGG
jgi:pyruvate formate lyase activating enzyme